MPTCFEMITFRPLHGTPGRKAKSLYRAACAISTILLASTMAMAQPQPTAGETLRFAVESEPVNYDCQANVAVSFLHSVAPSYSTLLKFDAANYPRITGDLAESWSISPDKLTYSFKLRPNVLFHDGASLTSSDVKATYQRILQPPPGIISARQSDYVSINAIDTPDPLTIAFHLQRPDAAMLAKFASPWNCIYQGAKLAADPRFPQTHILGTGPFVFAEHKKGESWTGRRWDRYFQPGKPYLDGYEADFMNGPSAVKAMQAGQVMAGFRSFTPAERDELETTLGDRINVQESPWLMNTMLVFNAKQAPFDDARVRRALSLAVDRWSMSMANTLSHSTVLKHVGGLMRPGFAMATPEATLATLPGFSHDIAASREEARRLLAEAGVPNLKITVISRDISNAYGPSADPIIDAWRSIGVTANEVRLSAKDYQLAVQSGHFAVALDLGGDAFDDPTMQLAKYVSNAPSNNAHSVDPTLDNLYVAQATSTDPQQRAKIVREFEQRALTEAYSVPILWWNRVVVTSASVKGWNMTPSPYIGQDLADVWIDRQVIGTKAPPPATEPSSRHASGIVPPAPVSTAALAIPAQEASPASTNAAKPVALPASIALPQSLPAPTEATRRDVPATPPALSASPALALAGSR
jgi:peptide/nickel transport system substrate-binding protein